jgi:carbon monoxide dehydrogenase subunit G
MYETAVAEDARVELTEHFVVPAPVDRVWQLFDDVPNVVTCMPGAEVVERINDHTYDARLTIAVGPIRPKFDVKATIERDDAAREGRISVHAVDRRGGSQARAEIVYQLAADGEGTSVQLVQNVTLSGPLAQFGRTGVIEDINAQMTRQFAECLAAKLAAPSPPSGSADEPPASVDSEGPRARKVYANEIRIVSLLARTLFTRILAALRLRK